MIKRSPQLKAGDVLFIEAHWERLHFRVVATTPQYIQAKHAKHRKMIAVLLLLQPLPQQTTPTTVSVATTRRWHTVSNRSKIGRQFLPTNPAGEQPNDSQ